MTRVRAAAVCEIRRKGRRPLAAFAVCVVLLVAGATAAPLAGRLAPFAPAVVIAAPARQAPAEEGTPLSPLGTLAEIVNFAIVAGALVYLLRSPFAKYLNDRRTQIRADLVKAEELRQAAAAGLADVDRRLKDLPGELETLKARGVEEIRAEEARIEQAAAAERERLLEQAHREIDLQLRAAERALTERAAELSVSLATERIRRSITEADQLRLVDRYVRQLDTTR